MPDWLYWTFGGVLGVTGAALLLWALLADWWRHRGRARRCSRCWYDMSGVAGSMQCPECGRIAKRELKLHRSRRRWGSVVASAILLLGAGSLAIAPEIQRRGWRNLAPTSLFVFDVWIRLDPESFGYLETRIGQDIGSGRFIYIAHVDAIPDWQWRMVISACNRTLLSKGGANQSAQVILSGSPPHSFGAFAGAMAAFVRKDEAYGEHKIDEAIHSWSWELQGAQRLRCTAGLREVLMHDDPTVRRRAATLLGAFHDAQAVPLLRANTKNEDAEVREASIYALGKIGIDAVTAIPDLLDAMGDRVPDVRQAAGMALGGIGSNQDSVVAALVEAARSDDACAVRAWVAVSLIELNAELNVAFPTLEQTIDNDDCDAERVLWRLVELGNVLRPLESHLQALAENPSAPIYLRNDARKVIRAIHGDRESDRVYSME